MTPTAIIALIKDAVILVAIGLAIWLFISYGKDLVKVADMKAVEIQLTKNAQTEADWRKEQTDANTKRDADLAKVSTAIGKQRDPVYIMRNPPSHCPVSGAPTAADNPPAASGTTDEGLGSDLRPALNRYELKYESVLADCRAVLAQWPTQQ